VLIEELPTIKQVKDTSMDATILSLLYECCNCRKGLRRFE
jgi:hypothetical protein